MKIFRHMFYSRSLTNWVGIQFFRLVRWVPPVFALICLAGVALGIYFVFWAVDRNPHHSPYLIKGIGLLMTVFYSGLLVMWCAKVANGRWSEFCDRQIDFFESR